MTKPSKGVAVRDTTTPAPYHDLAALSTPAMSGADKITQTAELLVSCKQIADAVAPTAMMPAHLRGRAEEAAAVMLYGASLGLDPMQSCRMVFEVHGQPGLYSRSMQALVVAAGHRVWVVEASDESVTVAAQRRGSEHVATSTWTIDRATRAGYVPTKDDTGKWRTTKNGKPLGNQKYLEIPQQMLTAKATAEVCREIAPDVLAGIHSVEEIESEPSMWRAEVVPSTAAAPRGLAAVAAKATTQTVPPAEPEPMITEAQRKRLAAVCNRLLIDQTGALLYASDVLEREISSSRELTADEADRLLTAMEADADAADTARAVAQQGAEGA